MSYKLVQVIVNDKKTILEHATLKECYERLLEECEKDQEPCTASFEDLEYSIEQNFGKACLYRFWGYYRISDEGIED